ncbi:response regulator transcription factor [Clostridium sp.]|uniref:response regulator n=1 Tax=Clostridium sp. TaxID=1506 RepID=UPI0025C173B3|nr:response regulator transcription factor [Clostridium sp.]MCI9070757.1 response regulator transcription factor [Clostridium sp.]
MNNYNERILVVEDDCQIRNFIKYIIEKEGYKLFNACNGESALSIIVSEKIDLIILDLGLPDFDGIKIIEKIREWSEVPIIVVSARDQDKDKVLALDTGADDYITKPFSASELLARIRVAIRHLNKHNMNTIQTSFSVGDLVIDFEKRVVSIKDEKVHLTPNEYSLITLLAKNAGKVITTSIILKEIWGLNYGSDTQALRALMAGLRRKIEDVPAKPRYIITEIGVGYRLVDE